MEVPGVDFTESFSPVASNTSTRTLIGSTLYYKDDGWVAELCDAEAAFLHCDMPVEMFIECIEGILDLGIITKEFIE